MNRMAVLQYRTASNGYWVGLLLPLAMFLSRYQSAQYYTNRTYHLGERNETLRLFRSEELERSFQPANAILVVLIANTFVLTLLQKFYSNLSPSSVLNSFRICNTIIGVIYLALTAFSKNDLMYERFALIAVNFVFPYVLYHLIAYFPKSFTFGEALAVTQGTCAFFWTSVLNVPSPPTHIAPLREEELITLLCQVGFLSIILISRLLVITKKPWMFMFMEEFICIWSKCCLLVVALRVKPTDIVFFLQWIFAFFFTTSTRMTLFAYWTTLFVIALSYVAWTDSQELKTSSADRKYFHFLVVAVYLPGVLKDYNLLYESTVALTYIFGIIELIRHLNFEVNGTSMSKYIDSSIRRFRDKQDEGELFLTPIYLLVGCSIPLWLHGVQLPFDHNDWSTISIISGILSVGIGDTFASIGGSKFGQIKWEGNGKSVEGTVFSIVSQLAMLGLLHITGFCSISFLVQLCAVAAIVINSLVEAKTDQIDNFILPLVTYNTIYGLKVILYCTNVIQLS